MRDIPSTTNSRMAKRELHDTAQQQQAVCNRALQVEFMQPANLSNLKA